MNEPEIMIDVAKQFSPYPAGRYRADGSTSGEAFREDVLWPALDKAGKGCVIVCMDGAMGYGSSFLEEAFGGLVREHHVSPKELRQRLIIRSKRKSVEKEIWEYIGFT
ncbi:MAG: STAS-like domain-containing protein [Aquisalimonadaceae bacterium]